MIAALIGIAMVAQKAPEVEAVLRATSPRAVLTKFQWSFVAGHLSKRSTPEDGG